MSNKRYGLCNVAILIGGITSDGKQRNNRKFIFRRKD